MKKLIVLATLAALPAVAMADVTISGVVGVGIQNTKTGSTGSVNDMNRAAGEVKFAGSEDLGNGLKAVWQIANRIDPTNDETVKYDKKKGDLSAKGNAWGGRDTFVGLKGSFGQIRFGNNSNPTNSGFSGNADVFTVIGLQGDGSYKDGEARLAHSIRFDSAEIAGFKFAITQQLKEKAGNSEYGSGVGVSYTAGPVTLIYSRAVNKNPKSSSETGSVTTVGSTKNNQFTAQLALGEIGLNFGYGDSKTPYYEDDANNDSVNDTVVKQQVKRRGYGVSATYAMGNITPMVGFWKQNATKINGVDQKDSYNVFSASVDYALSKRTNAGVEFQKQSEGKTGDKDSKRIAAVYLQHSF